MKTFSSVGVALLIIIIMWIVVSYIIDKKIKQPAYIVVEERDSYQIRRYEPYLLATVTVEGSSERERSSKAFRLLANYIFGGNSTQTSIEMTVPVQTETNSSTQIEMTAPIVTQQDGSELTMSFVLPSRFTLENVPKPLTPEVSLEQKLVTITATKRFTGLVNEKKSNLQKKILLENIKSDGLEIVSSPQILQYNQPWVFPWFRRNEASVEIKG